MYPHYYLYFICINFYYLNYITIICPFLKFYTVQLYISDATEYDTECKELHSLLS